MGFDQWIPQHLLGTREWFTPPNHRSALVAREKLLSNVQRIKWPTIYLVPFTNKYVNKNNGLFRSSLGGSVVNGDGSFKVINDLSFPHKDPESPSVNLFVDTEHFKNLWGDFLSVGKFFKTSGKNLKLTIYNWARVYRPNMTLQS